MKEFYIVTALTFLEIGIATWLVIELHKSTQELKHLNFKLSKESKNILNEFKSIKLKLKKFNTNVEENISFSHKKMEFISDILKESLIELIAGRFLHKNNKILFTTINKVWKHKIDLLWLALTFIFMNKKTA